MAFIDAVEDDQVPDAMAEIYAAAEEELGHVPNSTRAFAHRPAVYAAWLQLNGAIKSAMDLRRYELATVAAATHLRSSYCTLAHGSVLIDNFLDARAVAAVVTDHRTAGLSAADVAVMDLAAKVVDDATAVQQADIDRLRAEGLSDAEIFDVVLAAAARCFFSKALDALGVQPDAKYAALDPELRDVLTVGRAIAEP